jgi:hypothetical protein
MKNEPKFVTQIREKEIGCISSIKETPMTLQVTLLADDGILLASDTLQVKMPTLAGDVETASNESKIFLNPQKTIAAACCGRMLPEAFILSVIDVIGPNWEKGCLVVSECCFDLWKKEEEEHPFLGAEDSSLMIVHSQKRQVYKALFSKNMKPTLILKEENLMRHGARQGHDESPAYFFIRKYLPEKPAKIESLVRLAANYVLMAAELDPYGIGGLEIHVSKDGNPFDEVSEEDIRRLAKESRQLDSRIKEFILAPLSIAAAAAAL